MAIDTPTRTTVVTTTKAGGTGLLCIGLVFWALTFFWWSDPRLFWVTQIVSMGVIFFGLLAVCCGRRQGRTYVITEPDNTYAVSVLWPHNYFARDNSELTPLFQSVHPAPVYTPYSATAPTVYAYEQPQNLYTPAPNVYSQPPPPTNVVLSNQPTSQLYSF
jgi:hypothetical protein